MLKDMRSWRDNVREQSLRNFRHKAEWTSTHQRSQLLADMTQHLARIGYKFKVVEKEGATLIAAKQGAGNKWGYIFAHAAIVIICIGGMLDSSCRSVFSNGLWAKCRLMVTVLLPISRSNTACRWRIPLSVAIP
jgi:cytochrome c biogenesis protein